MSRKRRSKDYEPLGVAHVGTLLAEALRDPARIREALGVWPAWEDAVGPQVAAAARPVSLRNGVLLVYVRNPVWLQELHSQREVLLRRVQRVAAGAAVRELRLKVGAVPEREEALAAQRRPPIKGAPIPHEVTRSIREVQSAPLRAVLIRVASRWAGLARDRGE